MSDATTAPAYIPNEWGVTFEASDEMAEDDLRLFTNTLEDLRDCWRHMDEEGLSEAEQKSRRAIIRLCEVIASDYEGEGGSGRAA